LTARGLFVTGTDTGAGKTVLAAALIAAARERGLTVGACKPVVTGLDDPPDPDWPHDHELLSAASGLNADDVARERFGPPVSPHLAAQIAGRELSLHALARAARAAGEGVDLLVVEGVGGLLVPLTHDASVRDLAVDLGVPLVVAARPGLGTISHTLLTLEAARTAGLDVAAVVLTPWPDGPGMVEESNRETIARIGGVEVDVLARVERADPALLAAAGAVLPVERWAGPLSDRPRP
jgi:dethiobiotin synthetase